MPTCSFNKLDASFLVFVSNYVTTYQTLLHNVWLLLQSELHTFLVEKMHQYTQQKIQCNKQYVQPVTVPGTESVIYISGETNKKHKKDYPLKMRSVWIFKIS